MPGKKLSLNDFTESLAGFTKYKEQDQETNLIEYRKTIKIMTNLIQHELSVRQKECITLRYFEKMGVCQIAEKLKIDKSTASRHISRAKKKLKKLLEYYN